LLLLCWLGLALTVAWLLVLLLLVLLVLCGWFGLVVEAPMELEPQATAVEQPYLGLLLVSVTRVWLDAWLLLLQLLLEPRCACETWDKPVRPVPMHPLAVGRLRQLHQMKQLLLLLLLLLLLPCRALEADREIGGAVKASRNLLLPSRCHLQRYRDGVAVLLQGSQHSSAGVMLGSLPTSIAARPCALHRTHIPSAVLPDSEPSSSSVLDSCCGGLTW
jgi:hypothetical protein